MRFADEGARVALVASADIAKAGRVAGRIAAAGGVAEPFVADVTRVDEIGTLVKAVERTFGEVDILVNSAGVIERTPAGATSEADYDRIVDINLKGSFFCVEALVPAMKARGSGHIINISSIAGLVGASGLSAYCASKFGVIGMTKALACELAPHGIHVNAIAPGPTATHGNEHLRIDPETGQPKEPPPTGTRSGCAFSAADDMAAAALFLASAEGRAMHGSVMVLDEGVTAGFQP